MNISEAKKTHNEDLWPFIIFVISFTLRLAYVFEMKDFPLFSDLVFDALYYDRLALTIAGGDWLAGEKVFYNSPVYAYFLAVIYKVFGHNYNVVRVIQSALGSLTWVLVYYIGRDILNKKSAVFAALLGCLYDYMVFLDAELLKNSLAVLTFTAAYLCISKAVARHSKSLYIAGGFFFALTVANQPNTLVLLPLLILIPAYWKELPRLKRLLYAGLMPVIVILVVSPITIRNYYVARDLMLIAYGGGPVFYIGNNKFANGTGKGGELGTDRVPFEKEAEKCWQLAEQKTKKILKASEVSSFWYSQGMNFIYEEPLAFLTLLGKKALLFINDQQYDDNADFDFYKSRSMILKVSFVTYFIVVILAFTGLILSIGAWRRHLPGYFSVAGFIMSVIIFLVVARYRVTIVPLLCVYAALALEKCAQYVKEKKILMLIAAGALLTTFGALSALNIEYSAKEHTQTMLADYYFKNNRFAEAYKEYKEVLSIYPHLKNEKYFFEHSAMMTGKTEEALLFYTQLYNNPALDHFSKAEVYNGIQRLTSRLRKP